MLLMKIMTKLFFQLLFQAPKLKMYCVIVLVLVEQAKWKDHRFQKHYKEVAVYHWAAKRCLMLDFLYNPRL